MLMLKQKLFVNREACLGLDVATEPSTVCCPLFTHPRNHGYNTILVSEETGLMGIYILSSRMLVSHRGVVDNLPFRV